MQFRRRLLLVAPIAVLLLIGAAPAHAQNNEFEFNDSHFHLTNNVQEGPNIRDFLNMMGSKTGRVAIFGIPCNNSGRIESTAIGGRLTTCIQTLRCTTTLSRTRGLRWHTSPWRGSSKPAWIP